jgi:hypothetical protein
LPGANSDANERTQPVEEQGKDEHSDSGQSSEFSVDAVVSEARDADTGIMKYEVKWDECVILKNVIFESGAFYPTLVVNVWPNSSVDTFYYVWEALALHVSVKNCVAAPHVD